MVVAIAVFVLWMVLAGSVAAVPLLWGLTVAAAAGAWTRLIGG
jgi:multisubunit Na+/H+ antiporter MnhE subunit